MQKFKILKLICITLIINIINSNEACAQADDRYYPFYIFPESKTILLSGVIGTRAVLNFQRALEAAPNTEILLLNSNGGAVHNALIIAREAHRRNIKTFIPSDAECYSACSLIFFGGTSRKVDGLLGVHQISSSDPNPEADQLTISDIIEVLNEFNTPPEVLVPMFRTPPSDMYIFSTSELASMGLNSGDKPSPLPENSTPIEILNDTTPSPEVSAVKVAHSHFDSWSKPNESSLQLIRDTYTKFVDFYGNQWPIEKVMEDKSRFANRWPIRNYTLDVSTEKANCTTAFVCTYQSEVTWFVRDPSRNASSNGRALIIFNIEKSLDRWKISSESGSVLSRW